MSISLYAEYLLNIRQVTIYATLKNLADKRLQAHVSSDRKTLSVAYDGASKTIEFPSGVAGKATVDLPVDAQEFLSLRLEIAEDEDADKPPHGVGMAVANDQPWSAASLSPDVEMACRACAAALVRPGVVKEWRDLPRKGWAEAMDMWHCHKPAGSTNGTHPARDGKYGVLEGLVLQGETGLVDTCHFLVPEGACVGIKSTQEQSEVSCSACGELVGAKDDDLPLIKLRKWSVVVRQAASAAWEQNRVENFICAQLLELMDSQGIRKFMAYHGGLENAVEGLLLWVLIPDLKYSASCISDGQPRRAMKILYQKTQKPRDFVDANHESVDEFPLPEAILEKITDYLEKSNRLLPDSARTFQIWQVGLLDRFDPQ